MVDCDGIRWYAGQSLSSIVICLLLKYSSMGKVQSCTLEKAGSSDYSQLCLFLALKMHFANKNCLTPEDKG